MKTSNTILLFFAFIIAGCANAQLTHEDSNRVINKDLVELRTENLHETSDVLFNMILGMVFGDYTPDIYITKVDGINTSRELTKGNQAIALTPGRHRIYLTCSITYDDDDEDIDKDHFFDHTFELGKLYLIEFEDEYDDCGYSLNVIDLTHST